MKTEPIVVTRTPSTFSESEIQDFIALVRAGGEVGSTVLEKNVRNAESLVLATLGPCLVGVAALKNPQSTYRNSIHAKAGESVDAENFPFELGYVFVLPSARRLGIGQGLCSAALRAAGNKGVFATARTNNDGMQRLLPLLGFVKLGKPYASARKDYQLQLFIRYPAEQFGAAV